MAKKSRPLTQAEIVEVKQLLCKGRNRYDNALLEIEQTWNRLKPSDYAHRAKLTAAAIQMTKIDAGLRVWEEKVQD
jgi:hypothetical protein